MEKENYSQLELFSQTKDYGHSKINATHKSFLGHIRNYEKTLLIIIAFIIAIIVSFSLGVEKGKRTQIVKTQPTTVKAVSLPLPAKLPPQPVTEKQNVIQQEGNTEYTHNYYTIQVASYQSRASAEKEAETLKKRGLSSSIASKGKYTVVYVGNFSNKKIAESLLVELKKRYRDCLIRRL